MTQTDFEPSLNLISEIDDNSSNINETANICDSIESIIQQSQDLFRRSNPVLPKIGINYLKFYAILIN